MLETISVIVPVYKVEKYLDQCVTSIIEQSISNLEIILVEDGSPDQCGAMCDAWATKDQRIKALHKKNGGLSDARNFGLKYARGSYIAFVDSDDIIAPKMMEKLLDVIKQSGADIAECNYLRFSDNVPCYDEGNSSSITLYTTQEAMQRLIEESVFKYTVWNKLYRRKVFDSLEFEVGKLHEDVFFTYQAFGMCKNIGKIEEPLYYYRQREGSIMGEAVSLRNLDALEARKKQYFYMKDNFPDLACMAQSQVLGNCLYLGQQFLDCREFDVKEEALKRIKVLYDKIYNDQIIHESKKQKFWYFMAKRNFKRCCSVRNILKIGF